MAINLNDLPVAHFVQTLIGVAWVLFLGTLVATWILPSRQPRIFLWKVLDTLVALLAIASWYGVQYFFYEWNALLMILLFPVFGFTCWAGFNIYINVFESSLIHHKETLPNSTKLQKAKKAQKGQVKEWKVAIGLVVVGSLIFFLTDDLGRHLEYIPLIVIHAMMILIYIYVSLDTKDWLQAFRDTDEEGD